MRDSSELPAIKFGLECPDAPAAMKPLTFHRETEQHYNFIARSTGMAGTFHCPRADWTFKRLALKLSNDEARLSALAGGLLYRMQ